MTAFEEGLFMALGSFAEWMCGASTACMMAVISVAVIVLCAILAGLGILLVTFTSVD